MLCIQGMPVFWALTDRDGVARGQITQDRANWFAWSAHAPSTLSYGKPRLIAEGGCTTFERAVEEICNVARYV